MDYNSFAEKCVDELKVLQEKFQSEYNVTWYEHWFYDQTTGLLTFSTADKELNFNYIDVGSYSEKSNTWKWSWDNDSTLDKVKDATSLVKDFGQSSNFSKLTEACFTSDEIEAWAFTAIAAKLLNGIGVYRPVNDTSLKIFLVITEFVDYDTAQEIKNSYIECDVHDKQRIAFVCKHLNRITKAGFNEAFENMDLAEDDNFQAWCDECEIIRQKEGEWNDTSMAFATIGIVCEKCYFEIRELNVENR